MLTLNLWPQVGLCNGSAGTIHKILYQNGQKPPHLPIAVVVRFDKYHGPPFLQDHPSSIPVPPITFEWQCESQRLSRQQIPLQVRYAITIHKSQGQTLQKAVIDIGKSEISAGCTFVAILRLPRLNCGLIHPMPFRRLTSISSGRNFAARLQEESRLHQISLNCACSN
jgi:ATP-dependent DNA helicase PIF1